MTSRLILFALLAVVLILGGALLVLGEGPERATDGRFHSAGGPDAGPGMGLPPGVDSADDRDHLGTLADLTGATAPLLPAGADPGANLAGPAATARVTGRLFDVSGSPIAGEPVDLVADDDSWQGRLVRRLGPDIVDRTRSGKDGRFSVAARAGVQLVLLAGGERHPRLVLDPVAAGDELVLTLPPGLTVTGTVVEQETGVPVPGAFVGVLSGDDRFRTEASAEGHFSLSPVAEGQVGLGAWAPGFDMALSEKLLAGTTGVQLELPPGREVLGSLVDGETSEPIAGAEVSLLVVSRTRPGGELDPLDESQVLHTLVTTSDEQGLFRFEDAPSRSFRMEARAEGYVDLVRGRWEKRILAPDEQVTLEMMAERVISGVVLQGEQEAPAVGARMTLRSPDGLLAEGLSEVEGAFALPFTRWSGRGPLVVEAIDLEGRFARDSVRRGDDGLVLKLTEPLELVVQVVDPDGPVRGAHVGVVSKDAEPTLGVSDAQGEVRLIHRLADADIDHAWVSVRHGARASLSEGVDLSEGRPTEPVVVDLALGSSVAGRVVDPLGTGISTALVLGSHGGFCRTDGEGYFELSPIDPEAQVVELRVLADGMRKAEQTVAVGERDALVVLEPVVSWTLHVTDGSTGQPLEQVGGRLQIETLDDRGVDWNNTSERLSAAVGLPGDFTVRLPKPGRYRVAMGMDDRIPVITLPIDFDGVHQPAPLDVVMFRAAMLEVLVLDTRGQPVPGVEVAMIPLAPEELGLSPKQLGKLNKRSAVEERRTNLDGRTEFNVGEGGSLQLSLDKRSFALDRPLLALAGAPTPCTLRLPAGGDLLVEVSDARGAPLDGASITLRSTGKERPFDLRLNLRSSAPEGAALFERVPQGNYRVSVSRRGLGREEQELWVGPGFTRCAVRLEPPQPGSGKSKAGNAKAGQLKRR